MLETLQTGIIYKPVLAMIQAILQRTSSCYMHIYQAVFPAERSDFAQAWSSRLAGEEWHAANVTVR